MEERATVVKIGASIYFIRGLGWRSLSEKIEFKSPEKSRKITLVTPTEKAFVYVRNGHLHRKDGPAIIAKEYKAWYKDGVKHREDGPAEIIAKNSFRKWYQNGKLHCTSGPAVEWWDGTLCRWVGREWWIEGRRFEW